MKGSGVCPQTLFSQHMLKLHKEGEKRADALAWDTSYFEEFSLQSTGVMQGQKKKKKKRDTFCYKYIYIFS